MFDPVFSVEKLNNKLRLYQGDNFTPVETVLTWKDDGFPWNSHYCYRVTFTDGRVIDFKVERKHWEDISPFCMSLADYLAQTIICLP